MSIDPRNCLIYAIRNKLNDHCYVGSTVQVNRYGQHLNMLRQNIHYCTPLQRAWVKAGGKNNFEWIILQDLGAVSDRDRDLAEIHWINAKGYYNLVRATADLRNFTHSPETRKKLAKNLAKALENPVHRETKRKRSIEMWQNAEIRSKILSSLAKKYENKEYQIEWLLKIHSPEVNAKLANSIKNKWANDEEYKDKLVTAAKLNRALPASKLRMRQQTIDSFKNPETKQKHKLSTKISWADPVKRAARVAAFNTPEARQNRKEAARLGWLKRKQNKT